MLFCLSALSICTHTVYWKGHGLWLLSHWEPTCHPADMTLFECSTYMWSEQRKSTPHDKVTRGVIAAYKQGLSSPRQEAGSSRGAALSHLPAATTSDGVRDSVLDGCFDFSLCDTSVACHVVFCLSASGSRPGQMRLSSLSLCVQTGLALTNRPARCTACGRSGGLRRLYLGSWCHKPSILL